MCSLNGGISLKIHQHEDLTQIEFYNRRFGMVMKVSIYFMDGLLIDTGTIRKKQELTPVFETWNIDQVVLTHHHEDHSGLAYWLQTEKNVRLFSHQLGIEKGAAKSRLPYYRYFFWGPKRPYNADKVGKILETENYTWETIHTPGHAKDHIALYNREKGWMFGGDLYVQRQPKSIFSFESIPELIQSLQKILTYDFTTYMCSHVGIIQDGRKAIQGKLDYLLSIQSKIMHLHEQGWSFSEIKKKLFPERHMLQYLSLFDNSPTHIIRSIIDEKNKLT